MTTPAVLKGFVPADWSEGPYRATWIGPAQGGAQEVVLVFSPFARSYILVKQDLGRPVLHLRDESETYFLRQADALADRLASELAGRVASRVILLGSSKGATAALLFGSLLAARLAALRFDAYAFSPQTRLWPWNATLGLPSYAELVDRAASDPALRQDLERHGNLPGGPRPANYRALVTFGDGNRRDAAEARAYAAAQAGRGVRLNPLPISSHITLVPYVIDCADRQALLDALLGTAARNPDDADTAEDSRTARLLREVERYHRLGGLDLRLARLIDPPL